MEKLIQVCEAVPNPSRRWLGQTLIIIISSPEDMQTILNSPHCLEKPFLYDFMDPNNNGLFLAKAHIWKPTRKLLNPTFNNKILSSFIPVFNERTKTMVDNLEEFVDQDQFDISKQFFACTLEMVCGKFEKKNLKGGKCVVPKMMICAYDMLSTSFRSG